MPTERHYTASFKWDFIIDKLKDQQCLLVLGPEIISDGEGVSYHQQLLRSLHPSTNENVQRFYPGDDFFLFDDLSKQTLVCHDIKNFYASATPNETLRLIAEIPFHVILTVTPDKLLPKAFQGKDFAFQFGYYKKNKDPQPIKAPTKQNPLIYNLFGCLDSEESLVLTHNDLYDYFKSIFSRKSMPQLLKEELRNIRNILFLGVPFDKWYMQLLLRELEIHNAGYAFLRFAANQSMPGEIQTFCTEQFKINFIFSEPNEAKDDVGDFVKDLHAHCRQARILRENGGTESSHTDKIRACVGDGELEDAINMLEDCTVDSELQDDVIMLSGRYRNFKRRAQNNLLRTEDRLVQESNFANDILNLAAQLTN